MIEGPRPAPRARLGRLHRLARSDALSLALLVVLPIAVTVPFSIAGHPLLSGDNLNQNYPLRVLVGQQLAGGHLPLWDPWIWSGTPLLAGWNAGALFPGTWLFAVLPGIGAWTLNVVGVGALAGVGVYVFVRNLGCRWAGSLAAALAFTWTGFLAGQSVHLGLVEGTACMPWVLLALERLRRSPRGRAELGWVLLLGAASASTVLAGDPRAVTTTALMAIVFLVAGASRAGYSGAVRFLGDTAVGIGLGAGLSILQWLPGLSFLHDSSRGQTAYSFFTAGSLSFPRMGSQLALPFLLGGYGNFATPLYQGAYNLPEVTIGVGLLALVAFMAYVPEVTRQFFAWLASSGDAEPAAPVDTDAPVRSGSSPPRDDTPVRDRPDRPRQLGVWYATALVSVVLMAGAYTPLAHVLIHVPLFGGERLQNRNAALLDFALVVLLGFFVDDLLGRERAALLDPLRTWTRRLLAAVPPLAAAGVVVYAWSEPLAFERSLNLAVSSPGFFDALDAYLVPALVAALAIGAFALLEHLLSRRARIAALVVLLAADFGIFVANASYATQPVASFAKGSPTASRLAAVEGPFGRSAIFDPIYQVPATNPEAANVLGLTDLNILADNPSAAGYGSAVNGEYQNVTGTHALEFLNQSELATSTFDTLDLATVLSPGVFFGEDIPPHSPIPVAGASAVTADGLPGSTAHTPRPPPLASGPWEVNPGRSAAFVLPVTRSLIRVTVVVNAQLSGRPTHLRVAVAATAPAGARVVANGPVRADGLAAAPHFLDAPVAHGQVHVTFPATRADVVLVENPSKGTMVLGAVIVVTAHPDTRLLLDGALQGILSPPHWRFATTFEGFSAWWNARAPGAAWLQSTRDRSPDATRRVAGSVRPLNGIGAIEPAFAVTAPSAVRFVWSEGYARGWSATLTAADGRQRQIAMRRFGLVQSAVLPAGTVRLVLGYRPSSVGTSIVVTALTGLGFLVLLLALVAWAPLNAKWRRLARRPGRAAEIVSRS